MNYYEDVLGLIGNTPLVKLNRLNKGLKPLILAKMENLNPGFSVKDRIGISMIAAAEREGKLKPGRPIAPPAPNTGNKPNARLRTLCPASAPAEPSPAPENI